ncbi:MAG: reductase, partial [Streptomyces sp.]|nr:reductase [Streptomyces sp.]
YGGTLHEIDGPPGRGPLHHTAPGGPGGPAGAQIEHVGGGAGYPYPDGCGSWQQADVRTARDRLGWRSRIVLEESLADIWMEAACRI